MADDHYCYLTTVGRRTGLPHRIEVWYAEQGDALYLLAGGGTASDWVRNLVANPAEGVEIGAQAISYVAGVIEGATEEHLARTLECAKYQPRYDGDLTRWRDTALPVVLRRTDANP